MPIDYSLKWDHYHQKINHSAFTQDKQATMSYFQDHFYRKGVSWEGFVVRVILDDVGSDRVAANIFVQMTQNTDELVLGADLGLSVSAKFL